MSTPGTSCVWIIGGAGFLGAALARLCTAEGLRACVVDPACADGANSLCAPAGLPMAVERAAARFGLPRFVFFCAATRGGDAAACRQAFLAPVQSVSAAAPCARLVFCSSTSVYGDAPGWTTEQTPVKQLCHGRVSERLAALLRAEAAVLQAGGCVARLSALYGPGRCELLRRHLAGEPRLTGEPARALNYVHVEDAARALLLLAGADCRSQVFNVSGECMTKGEAYAMLEALTGRAASQASSPAHRRGLADHRISAERLKAACGWVPRVSMCGFIAEQMRAEKQ